MPLYPMYREKSVLRDGYVDISLQLTVKFKFTGFENIEVERKKKGWFQSIFSVKQTLPLK